MISNNLFIKQFKELQNSKNFEEIANNTCPKGSICIVGEESRNDYTFEKGIRKYAKWIKETYLKLY